MLSSSNIDIFDFLFNLLGVEVHKVLLKDLVSRLIWFPQVLQDLRNSKLDDWNRNQDSFKNYFSFFHLWPCVTLTYILPTYCWHFSGFILLKTISTFPPSLWKNSTRRLQNSKRTGCSVQSGSVARDRRNCFGIDARGLWLFPGQGQFVPTRARHTPALHTFTHLEQTQDGFLWTHTRVCQTQLRASPMPNFVKTLPLVKIHFCTQVTFIATF